MTDEVRLNTCKCLCSRLSDCQSTEYSWHNLPGTILDSFAKAAVLVPLVITGDGCIEVWLTERSESVRNDKGYVSFPGGMKELGDASAVDTSLREANEEIGLHSDQVTLILIAADIFGKIVTTND